MDPRGYQDLEKSLTDSQKSRDLENSPIDKKKSLNDNRCRRIALDLQKKYRRIYY